MANTSPLLHDMAVEQVLIANGFTPEGAAERIAILRRRSFEERSQYDSIFRAWEKCGCFPMLGLLTAEQRRGPKIWPTEVKHG